MEGPGYVGETGEVVGDTNETGMGERGEVAGRQCEGVAAVQAGVKDPEVSESVSDCGGGGL